MKPAAMNGCIVYIEEAKDCSFLQMTAIQLRAHFFHKRDIPSNAFIIPEN